MKNSPSILIPKTLNTHILPMQDALLFASSAAMATATKNMRRRIHKVIALLLRLKICADSIKSSLSYPKSRRKSSDVLVEAGLRQTHLNQWLDKSEPGPGEGLHDPASPLK